MLVAEHFRHNFGYKGHWCSKWISGFPVYPLPCRVLPEIRPLIYSCVGFWTVDVVWIRFRSWLLSCVWWLLKTGHWYFCWLSVCVHYISVGLKSYYELSSFICSLLSSLYHNAIQVILRVFVVVVEGYREHHHFVSCLYIYLCNY